MRPPSEVDVLVAGGGPAGAAAALSLRRHRPALTVAVADKATFPRDKSCGDALGPGADKVLADLGVDDLLAAASSPQSVLVRGPADAQVRAGGLIGDEPFRGYVVPRYDFDRRLLERAFAGGALDLTGWRLADVERRGPRMLAVLRNHRQSAHVNARLIIGADGAYSRVKRCFFAPHSPRHTHVAIRGYVDVPGRPIAEQPLQLDFFSDLLPGYGWLFPLDGGRANIGVVIPRRRSRGGDNPRRLLTAYQRRLHREGLLSGAPERLLAHQLPHAARLPTFTGRGVALAGDAAGMINPLTGEGIVYAMVAGWLLGATFDPDDAGRSLRAYEHAFRRRFRRHYRASATLLTAVRSRHAARAIIASCGRSERLVQSFATSLFGPSA